jgi:hypothetical protein
MGLAKSVTIEKTAANQTFPGSLLVNSNGALLECDLEI